MLPTFAIRKTVPLLVVACFLWTTRFTARAEPAVGKDENQEQKDWLLKIHSNWFQAAENDPEQLGPLLRNAPHRHRELEPGQTGESSSNERQQQEQQQQTQQQQEQRETLMGSHGYGPHGMMGSVYAGGYGNGGTGNGNDYGGGNDMMMGGGGMMMGGGGMMMGGGEGDGNVNCEYGKVIMSLFESAQANLIERVVVPLYNSTNKKNLIGVGTTTTSTDPTVAANIQKHVAQMKELLEGGGVIRQFDPLFAAMAQADAEHYLDYDILKNKGVHVHHFGSTPCGVALVQAHAATVSAFIEKGHDEAMRTHAVPDACN